MEYVIDNDSSRQMPTGEALSFLVHQPLSVGELIGDEGSPDLVVLGMVDERTDAERERITDDIMGGLVMEGSVEWDYVRFPRLHKALGRMVVGNKRYYTPVHSHRD